MENAASSVPKPPSALRTRWGAYALALGGVAVTFAFKVGLTPWIGERPLLVLFIIPVILTAYASGLGPALTATAAIAVGLRFFALPAVAPFLVQRPVDAAQWLIFIVAGVLVSILGGELHRARHGLMDAPQTGKLAVMERKVRLGFSLALGCLLVIGFVSYQSVSKLNDSVTEVRHTHDVLHAIDQVKTGMIAAQSAQRGYTISGQAFYQGEFDQAATQTEAALRELLELTKDNPSQRERLAQLAPLIADRLHLAKKVINARLEGGFEGARSSPAGGQGQTLQNRIDEALVQCAAVEQSLLRERQSRADQSSAVCRATLLGGGTLALAVVAAALLALGRDFAGSRRADAALREAGARLEVRVSERTAELEMVNVALQEIKERLRTVTDAARVGLVMVDPEHRYRYVNRAYSEILQLPAENLVGKRIADILPAAYEAQIRGRLETAFQGDTVNCELHLPPVTPSGRERYYAVSYEPAADRSGRIVVIVIVDISNRKYAEEAQRSAEANFRVLVEQSLVGIYVIQDGRFTYVNPTIQEFFGLSAEELTSAPVTDFIFKEDRALATENIRKRIAGEVKSIRYGLRMLGKDGRSFEVEVHGGRAEFNGRPAILGSMLDITERRRAEEIMRASEVQLRLFIEQAPASMAMCDREMNYLAVSRRWVREYGRGHGELIGLNHYEVHPELPEHWKEAHRQALAGQPQESKEDIWKQPDGSEIWLRWAVHPWTDAQGQIGGITMVTEDVTSNKRTAELLRIRQEHSLSLLRLSQKLEHAASHQDILAASREEVERTLGIRTVWFSLLTEDGRFFRRVAGGEGPADRHLPEHDGLFEIAGDAMLEEILKGDDLVVVEDARTDPRTNKNIVARLGNRTILNMPISLVDRKLGAIGAGTFGEEGVRPITATEERYFAAVASQIAAVLDRLMAMEERQRAEQTLAEERNLLRTLIDSMPDMIFTKDLEGRFGISNPAHLRVVGVRSEAALVGKTVFDVYPRELAERYHQDDMQVLAGGTPIFNREEPSVDHAGVHRWLLTIKVPLRNQAQELVGLVGMCHDITLRKEAEEARERQRRRTALLAEISQRLVLSDNPGSLIKDLFTRVAEELGVEYFLNYMIPDGTDRLVMAQCGGLNAEQCAQFTELQCGEWLCGRVASRRESLILNDLQNSDWAPAAEARAMGLTAFAGFPLIAAGRLIGTLAFASSTLRRFSDEEARLMTAVASQVAAALERTRLLTELSASEARFRELAESLPQLAWTCRPDGQCDYLGKQWAEYTGCPVEKHLGFGWAEQLHPEDQERALRQWKISATTGTTYDIEFRLRRHDGAYRWFKTRAVPFRDHQGRIIKWFGSNTDIQDLKQAEEAVRDREQRLHLILDQLDAIVWTTDHELRITSMAGAGMKTLGVLADQRVGRTMFELMPRADDAAPAIRAHHLALQGTTSSYEIVRNGRDLRASTAPFRDASGTVTGVIGLAQDITEQKRAEAAVRESEIFNKEVLDSLTAHIAVLDRQGSVVIVNEAWRQFAAPHFQGEPIDILGASYLEVCESAAARDRDELAQAVLHGIREVMTGTEHYFGLEYSCPSPEAEQWFQLHVCPLTSRSSAVVMAHENITSRKHAEQAVRELNAVLEERVAQRTSELQSANRELESFSYSVSHDLRAPLRAVDGFSQAVLEDYGPLLPAEGHRFLQTIRDGAQRMGQLIDDLLTFSRLSRAELTKREIDTEALVRATFTDLETEQIGRKIEIKVGPLPPSFGDPALLRQVWTNLLSNALKYTRQREHAVIEIGWRAEPESPAFFVRDNGSGFDMRYAHKLFGVFQRLHRSEEFEGTGVGLAIVQRIIHRHGGRIWVTAAVDAGATFWFTIEGSNL